MIKLVVGSRALLLFVKVIKKAYIEEKSNDGLPDSVAANISWENHKKRNQSIIVELFQVRTIVLLSAQVCVRDFLSRFERDSDQPALISSVRSLQYIGSV